MIDRIGKVFQNKIGKWQVKIYLKNGKSISKSSDTEEAINKFVMEIEDKDVEFNTDQYGFITSYSIKGEAKQDIPFKDNAKSFEDNRQEQINMAWSINCALQFAQLNPNKLYRWEDIIEEAEKLRKLTNK